MPMLSFPSSTRRSTELCRLFPVSSQTSNPAVLPNAYSTPNSLASLIFEQTYKLLSWVPHTGIFFAQKGKYHVFWCLISFSPTWILEAYPDHWDFNLHPTLSPQLSNFLFFSLPLSTLIIFYIIYNLLIDRDLFIFCYRTLECTFHQGRDLYFSLVLPELTNQFDVYAS